MTTPGDLDRGKAKKILVTDSIGTWVVSPRGDCAACGADKIPLIVRPQKSIHLPDGIEVRATILARGTHLGISCGCYAKLHRQIAHISDNIRRRP